MKLSARGLGYAYGGVCVLSDLSVTVEPGSVVGLMGPNGAGKSTAMAIIAGQLQGGAGSVWLGEKCLDGMALHRRVQSGLGYLPQQDSVFRDCTVRENLELAAEGLGAEPSEVDEQLCRHGIAELESQQARTLSGGERRRLALARCLVGRPSILILDEPFSGIDPVGIEDLQRSLRKLANEGTGLLITDHAVVTSLGICDWAVILDAGTVMVEGRPEVIAQNETVKARYLGQDFELKKTQ